MTSDDTRVRKKRGRPPLTPEERARRAGPSSDLPPEELKRRQAISAAMRRCHAKKGHRMTPIPEPPSPSLSM